VGASAVGARRPDTESALPSPDIKPERLHAAMRYAALSGGKRVRPLLAYAAGELAGAEPARVDHVAAAVELIHAYSLVHDDLPCMDDDVLRRGRPTCHVQFDEATALLVDDPSRQIMMIATLAQASGSRGMAGGQAVDLESCGQSLSVPELEFMHIHKTGALIRASVSMAALCGDALTTQQRERLDHFGKVIGLAFQVVDDVLDADATTDGLGKTAGKDARQNKPTYVSAMGVAAARSFAAELLADARSSLQSLPQAGGQLADLAEFIVQRRS
jgi:farnesyl diphosphate synthase